MTKIAKQEKPALRRFFGPHPINQLRQEMEDALGNMFGDVGLLTPASENVPRLDVSETNVEVRVETDLPGYKPQEVDIELNDNYLTISGSHTEEQKEESKDRKYHRAERRSGSFSRSVLLPCAVDQKAVDAELKEGVLTVTLPKSEEEKRHKIAVKG